MATIVEPVSFEKEERVKIPTTAECIAVSGYANFFNDFHPDSGLPLSFASPGHNMIGDLNDDDNLWIHYEAHLLVGPKWSLVTDVSPVVTVAGFTFTDSDSADASGVHIDNCKWDTVGDSTTQPPTERIRLKVSLRMCGGIEYTITKLAYHFVATGRPVKS